MTVNESGESLPLEVAVINSLPLHDPYLCRILRDDVCIAAQCVNAKLPALQTKSENTMVKGSAAELLVALQIALQDFEKKHARARYRASSSTLIRRGIISL